MIIIKTCNVAEQSECKQNGFKKLSLGNGFWKKMGENIFVVRTG